MFGENQRFIPRSWKMLLLVASQAVVLSQAKQTARTQPQQAPVALAPHKRLLSRAFHALVKSRMLRARIEIEHHRRLREELLRK
jgi:hypothetical protein